MDTQKITISKVVRQIVLSVGFLLFVVLSAYGLSRIDDKQVVTPQPSDNISSINYESADDLLKKLSHASIKLPIVAYERDFNANTPSMESSDKSIADDKSSGLSENIDENPALPDSRRSTDERSEVRSKIVEKITNIRGEDKRHHDIDANNRGRHISVF